MGMISVQIMHLIDCPEFVPTLESWFVEEWAPWYGPGGAGDAKQDLVACRSKNQMPICLVAVGEDGNVIGTAALKAESVGDELGVGPWLAAVLVARAQRGQGIGTRLIAAMEDEARRLGFEAMYCSTDTAEGILKQRGWQLFGKATSLRGGVTVYRFEAADGKNQI